MSLPASTYPCRITCYNGSFGTTAYGARHRKGCGRRSNQEVACKGQQEINVILIEDLQTLDEVVVVGYGR